MNGDRVRQLVGPHLWDQLVEGYREDFAHRGITRASLPWHNNFYLDNNVQEQLLLRNDLQDDDGLGESDLDQDLLNLLLEALAGKTSADLRRI